MVQVVLYRTGYPMVKVVLYNALQDLQTIVVHVPLQVVMSIREGQYVQDLTPRLTLRPSDEQCVYVDKPTMEGTTTMGRQLPHQ